MKKLRSLQNSYKIHLFHSASTALLPANKVHFLSAPPPSVCSLISGPKREKLGDIFQMGRKTLKSELFHDHAATQPSGRQFQYISSVNGAINVIMKFLPARFSKKLRHFFLHTNAHRVFLQHERKSEKWLWKVDVNECANGIHNGSNELFFFLSRGAGQSFRDELEVFLLVPLLVTPGKWSWVRRAGKWAIFPGKWGEMWEHFVAWMAREKEGIPTMTVNLQIGICC